MDLPLTGSAEHKALVMVIERLEALEASQDRVVAAIEKACDPLLHVATDDPLLHIKKIDMHAAFWDYDSNSGAASLRYWGPTHTGFHVVCADVSCPRAQARLKEKKIQQYLRKFDLAQCEKAHRRYYGGGTPLTSMPDKWYVCREGRPTPVDAISTWERVV